MNTWLTGAFERFRTSKKNTKRKFSWKKLPLRLESLEDRITPVVTDMNTMMAFSTIQMAVNAANPGDTILADAGTYAEHVTVDRTLTIWGAQHGVNATTPRGAESIV